MLIIDFNPDQVDNSISYMKLPLLVLVNGMEERSLIMRQYTCIFLTTMLGNTCIFPPVADLQATDNRYFNSVLTTWFNSLHYLMLIK